MKKLIIMIVCLLLLTGCGKEVVDRNYLEKEGFSNIKEELSDYKTKVEFTPTKEFEEHYSELIKNIRDNTDLYSNEELKEIYHTIEELRYTFKYTEYTNNDYNNDLQKIKICITE